LSVPGGMMRPCGIRSTCRTSGNRRAEEAGWDALLVWDHVVEKGLRRQIADPWILLTAAALATRRIRLGTVITPVARRRPSKLAREVATLDCLTSYRLPPDRRTAGLPAVPAPLRPLEHQSRPWQRGTTVREGPRTRDRHAP
jgi:hypothetical protein